MKEKNNWEIVSLGEQLDLIRNGYSGKQISEITEYPVSRIETISNGYIDLNKVGYVEKISSTFLLNEGDILFSNINSLKHIGKVAYVDKGVHLYHGMNLLIFRSSESVVSKFLYYKLVELKPWFEKMAAQAVNQASINQEEIKKCQFSIPSAKSEQFKIVEILEVVDKLIKETESLIAKEERIKIGLMQDLLTKGIDEEGNIRADETHEFKDSLLGRIPSEWGVYTIDDLAIHVGSGITPRGGETVYKKEGVLFLRSQNIHFRGLKLSDVAYISKEIHESMGRSEVFENDVLLNITGASIGRCCFVPALNTLINVNQHVCAIRLKQASKSDAGYLSYVLESSIGQNQILQFNAGGNREGLNYQNVRSFHIPWPSKNERMKIFDVINNSNASIEDYNFELKKFNNIKKALMQDLLSGKKRVTQLLKNLEVMS